MSTDLGPSDRARERDRDRERARARRARTRRRVLAWLVRVAAAAVLLFAGIAIGRALDSGDGGVDTNTSVRTLEVTTLMPQETVTVTVSNP